MVNVNIQVSSGKVKYRPAVRVRESFVYLYKGLIWWNSI